MVFPGLSWRWGQMIGLFSTLIGCAELANVRWWIGFWLELSVFAITCPLNRTTWQLHGFTRHILETRPNLWLGLTLKALLKQEMSDDALVFFIRIECFCNNLLFLHSSITITLLFQGMPRRWVTVGQSAVGQMPPHPNIWLILTHIGYAKAANVRWCLGYCLELSIFAQ